MGTLTQESLKVGTLKGQIAVGPSDLMVLQFLFREIDNSEQGDLHTFHHSNDEQQDHKENDGNRIGHTGVHVGLSMEQGHKRKGTGVTKDSG